MSHMTHCGRFLQAPYLPVGYLTLGMFGRLRRWLLLTVMSSVCWYILSTRRSRSGIARSEDSVATASPTREHLLTSYYVTLCRNRFRDSHRTGNYLFFLAGLLYAAQLTGRTVSVPKHYWPLDEIFQMDGLHRYRARPICPCHELAHQPPVSYHGDANLDSARGRAALRRDRNRTVALCRLYTRPTATPTPSRRRCANFCASASKFSTPPVKSSTTHDRRAGLPGRTSASDCTSAAATSCTSTGSGTD